ncbi:MAG: SpoIIE family protein phosphatase [Acidobacteria bacterium]|nr:SpoIIE family protein phosphatase [Acidobacteriota bacterium]
MSSAPRLRVLEPGGAERQVPIQAFPFTIGRQKGNELTLSDTRISRQQAKIEFAGGKYILEDLQSRHGTFVNGQKISARHELRPRDTIEFGVPDSFRLVYEVGEETSVADLVNRVEATPATPATSRELYHLGVLLEVVRVMHTSLALEDLLTSVVDAAIQVTHTERGVLLLRTEGGEEGELHPSVARDHCRGTLDPKELQISSSILKQVIKSRRELIVSDPGDALGALDRRQQDSMARLELRTVIAIPLEKLPVLGSSDTTVYGKPAELLGVLYLDSRAVGSAFSDLGRQTLRALALEAATVVENARLFSASREKERLEHEMQIAAEIQQQLLPKSFPEAKEFSITGLNIACQSIGGDYFDAIGLPAGRCGVVVADVSGKGIPAALLASMLQGVFSATAGMDIALNAIGTRVNKYLCERTGDDRYATLFYSVLDPGGRLEYINAGHVSPLVRTTMGQVYTLASDSFPLGMFDFAEYHAGRAQLQPGDFLIVYTDGFSEAHNMRNDMFGESGLREILRGFSGTTALELSDAIQAGVRQFTGGAPQSDDMTLVVVHYRGSSV